MPAKTIRTTSLPVDDGKSLRYNTLYAIPESAANSIVNSYSIAYAIAMKASAIDIGILSSARNVASTLAQLPGALPTQHASRKSIWFVSTLIARLLWLPVVFMALFGIINITLFIVLMALYSFFLALNTPSLASMMSDMVPDRIRGMYFGRRNI